MDLESILQVALGKVAKPVIHTSINGGEEIKFEGDQARIFAIGFLTGFKASKPDTTIEINSELG